MILNAPFALAKLPVRFSSPMRNALVALGYARRGWSIEFGADDDGDEWAAIMDDVGDLGGIAAVYAGRGSVEFVDASFKPFGIVTTPEALTMALLAFLDGFDRDAEAERQETAWHQVVAGIMADDRQTQP